MFAWWNQYPLSYNDYAPEASVVSKRSRMALDMGRKPHPTLFPSLPFAGFGGDPLRLDGWPGDERILVDDRLQLRVAMKERCPKQPGIYGMVDGHGEVIYIGKAKRLQTRLSSYLRPRKGERGKARRILRHTRLLAWETVPHEFAALVRELNLIRRWRPRFNVMGQPDGRRRVFLCLGRGPAPYVYLSSRPHGQALARWGPLPLGRWTRLAARALNDHFRLRECPQPQVMRFAEQGRLFDPQLAPGCLRFEIGTCLGPCAALCSERQYQKQVRQVRRFLDVDVLQQSSASTNQPEADLLAFLESQMIEAGRQQQFERAARLRDDWRSLVWLKQRLQRLEQAKRDLSLIYPIRHRSLGTIWYVLRDGQPIAAGRQPVDRADRASWRKRLQQWRGGSRSVRNAQEWLEDREMIWLVASWFRKYPKERAKTLSFEQALKQM